jgi:hypothetical protein
MATPANSATGRTLAVTELLELILLKTRQRTLLTSCIRVCRRWQALINTSSALQKHLYFLPHETRHFSLNPLLDWGFPGWFSKKHWIDPRDWEGAYAYCEQLPIAPHDDDEMVYGLSTDARALNKFLVLPWNTDERAWRYNNASWRKMQTSQPPVRALGITHIDDMEWNGYTKAELEFPISHDRQEPDSLLMGDLYDYVESVIFEVQEEPLRDYPRNFFFERPMKVRDHLTSPDVHMSLVVYMGEVDIIFGSDEEHRMPRFKSDAYRAAIQPEMMHVEYEEEYGSVPLSGQDWTERMYYYRGGRYLKLVPEDSGAALSKPSNALAHAKSTGSETDASEE